MAPFGHIVNGNRHLLKRTAEAEAKHVRRLQRRAQLGSAKAALELRELKVRLGDLIVVDRGGRIRARWVVRAGPSA